jgi:hypothetical protein
MKMDIATHCAHNNRTAHLANAQAVLPDVFMLGFPWDLDYSRV